MGFFYKQEDVAYENVLLARHFSLFYSGEPAWNNQNKNYNRNSHSIILKESKIVCHISDRYKFQLPFMEVHLWLEKFENVWMPFVRIIEVFMLKKLHLVHNGLSDCNSKQVIPTCDLVWFHYAIVILVSPDDFFFKHYIFDLNQSILLNNSSYRLSIVP